MGPKATKLMKMASVVIPGILLFIALGGEVVKLLWNWLLPPLFGWREITFWQAIGVLTLCRILFGRLGGSGPSRFGFRRAMAERLADRVGDRWDAMTPTERERFRDRVRERCGFDPATDESKA
jgi:hypothetical protein